MINFWVSEGTLRPLNGQKLAKNGQKWAKIKQKIKRILEIFRDIQYIKGQHLCGFTLDLLYVKSGLTRVYHQTY